MQSFGVKLRGGTKDSRNRKRENKVIWGRERREYLLLWLAVDYKLGEKGKGKKSLIKKKYSRRGGGN